MKKPVYLLILFAIMALIVSGCSEPTIDGDEKPYVGYIALDISNADETTGQNALQDDSFMSELTVSQDGLTYPVRYVEGGKLFDSVVEPPFDDHYFKVVVCCCGFYGPLYGSYYNFRRWILPGFYFKDKNYVFDPDKKILIYGPIPEVESYDYTLTLSRPGYKDVNIRAVFNIPENTERCPYKGHYNNKDIYVNGVLQKDLVPTVTFERVE